MTPLISSIAPIIAPWPLAPIIKYYVSSPTPADVEPAATRYRVAAPVMTSPWDHLALIITCGWKFIFALAVYYLFPTNPVAAADLDLKWVVDVVIRDLVITYIVGAWDFVNLSPMSPVFKMMKPHKFNPVYPSASQLRHDIFWTTVSTLITSAWEVGLLHLWATGWLSLRTVPGDRWWADPWTMAAIFLLPYLQGAHFFFVHRGMHKWGTTSIPDVGAFLYKHVHSLHHKSRNPTVWSGISMHPVESAAYFSTMGFAALLGAHPLVLLHCKFFSTVAAMVGHDGFGDPSTGGHGHWLHHHLVTCNYSEPYVALDWLFGTWAATEDDFQRRLAMASGSKDAKGADKSK